jgi:glycosyltransferase involved in cell wall biosynthesis
MTRTLSISLVTLGDPDTLTGGYLYHRRMQEFAPANGARLEFVSLPARPFPLPALAGRRALRAIVEQGADVLVVDSIAAAFLVPRVRSLAVPMVGSLHQPPGGIDHRLPRRTLQAALDRVTYRRAARLLVASDLLAGQLAAQGFADRLTVVPPGRDVAQSPGGAPRDLRGGAKIALLCVGNWVPRKGILDLLEAVARLPPGTVRLHLAGDEQADPAYAARVRQRLARIDVAARVVRHGLSARGEVARLYRDADVFVLPSVREPYGTVYGEAMAAGLPVVGWRAGNLPHLAQHGREGMLVDTGDLDGLAAALSLLAEDRPLRRRLGEAARQRAAGFPTWEQTARRFFTAIRTAALGSMWDNHRPRRPRTAEEAG